jgi:hypothetical protein
MKQSRFVKKYLFVIISILCWSGCSNSFLNEQPEYKGTFTEPLIVDAQSGDLQSLTINIPEVQSAYFQIRQYPGWMEFQQMDGRFSGGIANINFRILPEKFNSYGENRGIMAISIKGFGLVSLDVITRNPEHYIVNIEPDKLDFRTDVTYLQFYIQNRAPDNVSWEIIDCPGWIQPEVQNGLIVAGDMQYLTLTCNRTNLDAGNHSGLIAIKFDWDGISQTKTISVSTETTAYANPAGLIEIEGLVADAIYCKESDRLFIATKQPNRLLVYNGEGEKLSDATLSKAPNCLSLSENGQQLFIGHSGLVSHVNSVTMQISNTYEVDFNVFDLAYGENDLLYISPDAEYAREPLICLNLTDGGVSKTGSNNLITGKIHFRKIKGKPLLLCTRENLSPSGIILVDITNGKPGREIYWHEDFGKNFWLSEDNRYTYGAYGHIYVTPDSATGNDILPLGRFESTEALWIDHCANTNSIWYAVNNYWEDRSYVNRYHAGDYYLTESFGIGKYATTVNGVKNLYKTLPHYVFSNKAGTHVFVIKNIFVNYYENVNAWSMEILNFNNNILVHNN